MRTVGNQGQLVVVIDSEKSVHATAKRRTVSVNLSRMINVKNCPLCDCLRPNKKAEVAIVTHLAVYASGGDFVKDYRVC